MQGRSAFEFGGNRIVRQSEPMKIGKHEWRLTLYRSPRRERPFVGYEWRRADGAPIRRSCPGGTYWLDGSTWMRDEDWPSYDHNDGEWGGMPRTLRKLWENCPWAHTREARPARPSHPVRAANPPPAARPGLPPPGGPGSPARGGRPGPAWARSRPRPTAPNSRPATSLREPRRNTP